MLEARYVSVGSRATFERRPRFVCCTLTLLTESLQHRELVLCAKGGRTGSKFNSSEPDMITGSFAPAVGEVIFDPNYAFRPSASIDSACMMNLCVGAGTPNFAPRRTNAPDR